MTDNIQVWSPKEANPARERLKTYRLIVDRRNALLDELDRTEEANERATSRLTATRLSGTGGHASFADGVLYMVDGEALLRKEIAKLNAQLEVLLGLINSSGCELHKNVLTYRYVNGLDWPEIGKKLHYERAMVFKLHGSALAAVCRYIEKSGLK